MRSPFTGVVFALELTHRYDALLPLIIGAVTAFAVSVLLLKRSVLTEKIARRGYHLTREYDVDPLEILFVSEVMTDDVLEFERRPDVAEALAAIGAPERRRSRLAPAALPGGRARRRPARRGHPARPVHGEHRGRRHDPVGELMRDPRCSRTRTRRCGTWPR